MYQRRNIERVTVKDFMNDETYEQWEYDERKMTPEEYLTFMAEKNRSDIEYLMAMSETVE